MTLFALAIGLLIDPALATSFRSILEPHISFWVDFGVAALAMAPAVLRAE